MMLLVAAARKRGGAADFFDEVDIAGGKAVVPVVLDPELLELEAADVDVGKTAAVDEIGRTVVIVEPSSITTTPLLAALKVKPLRVASGPFALRETEPSRM
jgi:hypothetical protein